MRTDVRDRLEVQGIQRPQVDDLERVRIGRLLGRVQRGGDQRAVGDHGDVLAGPAHRRAPDRRGGHGGVDVLPHPVAALGLEEDHRITLGDRMPQQPVRVGRRRRDDHLQSRRVQPVGLGGLRMMFYRTDSAERRDADRDRHVDVAPGARPILKPANIFITQEGTVKLLDLGIAKLIDGTDPSAALTQSRVGPLTPQYAAPEQLLAQPVTTATDIYTLGLVLYVCLTGTHPVPANTRSSAELVRTVLTQEPARASNVAAGAGIEPRALRGDLDNVLAKALKKSPAERYLSAGAFADDLKRYLNHEPVGARADTIPYRIGKFVRRHRGGVVAGTVIAAALTGAVAFAVTQLFEARAQRDVARYEEAHAQAQVELTEFLLGDSMSQAPHEILGNVSSARAA